MATVQGGNNQQPARKADSAEQRLKREAEELAIGPLLARANLLRVRGQWEGAVAACTEALRKFPTSAAAHSLMAQIYEAQGRPDDAITWYGLALNLDPDNAADRARWEKLTEAQRIRLREQTPPPPKSARERTIEKTLGWIDRLFPPGQSNTVARMIYALCIVISVLLIVSATVFYLATPRTRVSVAPTSTPTVDAPPVVVPPPPIAEPKTPTSRTSPTPGPSPSPSPAPMASPAATPAPASGDVALQEALNRAVNGTFTVVMVYRNPSIGVSPSGAGGSGSSVVTLDLTLPVLLEWSETRTRIIRSAAQAAQWTMNADPSVDRVVTRVALTGLGPRPAPVFTGELTRAAVTNIDPEQSPVEEVLARFTALQWIPLPVMERNPVASGNLPPGSARL